MKRADPGGKDGGSGGVTNFVRIALPALRSLRTHSTLKMDERMKGFEREAW
jgi:hypothetical protein